MRYSLHITNNCNLRCTYCYEDDKFEKNHKNFVISFSEIDEKINKILDYGNCDELELLGGEIFLYFDKVQYIFEKYSNCLSNIVITTNGTIRNDRIDELLRAYRPFIGVSLDDPQTIEKQRIGINFKQVLENAKYWNSLTSVCIAAVLNPLNLQRIKETFDFYILQEGFKKIHFGCVEEWMNDHYWYIYKREVARLIQNIDQKILAQVVLSPWESYDVFKKEYLYEDGVEKMQIFNNHKVEISKYLEARYYCYCLYCEQLGLSAGPMVPEGVEIVSNTR